MARCYKSVSRETRSRIVSRETLRENAESFGSDARCRFHLTQRTFGNGMSAPFPIAIRFGIRSTEKHLPQATERSALRR